MTTVATSKRRPQRLTVEQIERVLDGDFDRPSASPFYLMGLFIVAVAMILLPLVYVGIVAGTLAPPANGSIDAAQTWSAQANGSPSHCGGVRP